MMEKSGQSPKVSGSASRQPSHSSPNSSNLSDSPFGTTCSISPVEPNPSSGFPQCRFLPPPATSSNQGRGKSPWLPDLTARQWLIFSIFTGTNFLVGMVYNMKGPFYPQEAEMKMVTPSQYGFVFGIFELTKVFASPLYGKYMNQLGARRVFIASLYIVGIVSILFGLLEEISNPTGFLVCSLVLRVVEAVGSSGYSCALFSIIAHEFPGSVSTAFAILEACFGIGLIIAPPLGGILYQIAGFPLPFITVGLLIFTSVNFICVIMPRNFTVRNADGKATEGINIFRILTIPGVLFSAAGILAVASTAGFINATLEPHLRQFGLSPFYTGVVYSIFGLVYSVSAPAFGWISDRVREPKYVTLLGAISNLIAFLFMGPAPFFNFDTILWVTCVSLVLHGLALGSILVSLFGLAFSYAVDGGMPNDMKTHAVVSGMFTSVLSMGMFLGPSVGGILFEMVGFRWGSLFVVFCMIFLIALVTAYLILQKSSLPRGPSKEPPFAVPSMETEPLIGSSSLSRVFPPDQSGGAHQQIQTSSYGAA